WNMNCCDSAQSFTAHDDVYLASIEIALEWFSFVGGTNEEEISLMSDSMGVPEHTIESFDITGIPEVGTLMFAPSILHPLFETGVRYWIVAARKPGIGWNWNNTGDTGFIYSESPGIWFVNTGTTGAYRVEGTEVPVPEPGSLLLVSTGAAAILVRRR